MVGEKLVDHGAVQLFDWNDVQSIPPPSRNVDLSRLFGPSGVSKKYFSTKSLTSFFSFVDILQT